MALKNIIPKELDMMICGEIFGKRMYRIGTAIIPPPTPKRVETKPTEMPVAIKRRMINGFPWS